MKSKNRTRGGMRPFDDLCRVKRHVLDICAEELETLPVFLKYAAQIWQQYGKLW
jgi:hypothetical protein